MRHAILGADELLELSRLLGVENVRAATEVLAVDEDIGDSLLTGLLGEVSLL